MRDTRRGLAQRARILQFIADHIERHGYPPSVGEIQAALGISSPSLVIYHLRRLEAQGRIKRTKGKRRVITVVEGESCQS